MQGTTGSSSIDPRDYGAVCDTWAFTYGMVDLVNAPNVLIMPNTLWQSTAVAAGNPIAVRGAGPSGTDLLTSIASANGNQLTLATAMVTPPATSAGYSGLFGTDDAAAINQAIEENSFPAGVWSISANAPTWPPTTNSAGEWVQGPQRIVLRSSGRNNSLFGILSPIRLMTGVQIDFQTPVQALPGFSGQAMVHQTVDNSGNAVEIGWCKLLGPKLLGGGFAPIGLWIEYGFNNEISGDCTILETTLTGVRVGNVAGLNGASLNSFTGRVFCTAPSVNTIAAGSTNVNNDLGIGFQFVGNCADNTVNGDVWCQGFRTGYQDGAGCANNKVHGTVHCWTGSLYGFMTTAVNLSSSSFHIDRILSDSAANAPGESCYGLILGSAASGNIGVITDVWNFTSNITQSNQFTLVKNNSTSPAGISIGSIISSTNNNSYKIKNIVDGNTHNLSILYLGTDGNYTNLGYNTEAANRQNAIALIQSEILAINAILPGQRWDPTQLDQSQVPLWLDAAATNTLTLNGSSQVTAWASRTGAAEATVPASATAPLFDATGFRGIFPGVIFDGLVGGNCLNLGPSTNGLFQDATDFLAFFCFDA